MPHGACDPGGSHRSRRGSPAPRALPTASPPLSGHSCPQPRACRSGVGRHRPARSTHARPALPGTPRCGVARGGPAGSLRGVRPTSVPCPRQAPRRLPSSCGGAPPGERLRRSGGPTSYTRAGPRAACAARRWSCGVTVGALTVSPVFLPSPPCCPASPSLPWGLWACGPHLPRDYAPLRRPLCPSRDPALGARAPRPGLLRSVRGVPAGLVGWSQLPNHTRAFGPPCRDSDQEADGTPGVPSYPGADLPRS